MIEAISAANTGIQAGLRDLASSAHNVANIRTGRAMLEDALQGEILIREENPAGGVSTQVVPSGDTEGIVVHEPTHDGVSDAGDLVRYPSIDVGSELVRMQMAQREVDVNLVSIEAAVDTYRDLLSMTNRDRERMTATSA